MIRQLIFAATIIFSAIAFGAMPARAQIPVIDGQNLAIATQNAANTASIMNSNTDIKNLSNQILQAVTGQRTGDAGAGGLLSAGLGGGNSIANAPSWGSLMSGVQSFGGLGSQATGLASDIINGLNLTKKIASLFNGGAKGTSPIDTAFSGSVNTAAALAALTAQASQGVQQRSGTFSGAANLIGTSNDVKGSIDQNSQISLQHAQTTNELIGVTNGAVAALNAEQVRKITQQSMVAQMLQYQDGASPFR